MKKLISIVLILSLMVPIALLPASALSTEEDFALPPWVGEGETWHPSDGVMPLEDDSCPQGHYRPNGYAYQGYTEGNTIVEGFRNGAIVLITSAIPGFGAVTTALSAILIAQEVYDYYANGGVKKEKYIKYVYTKGNQYWYHIVWLHRTDHGLDYLTCMVDQGYYD